jgi:hypothetical protein
MTTPSSGLRVFGLACTVFAVLALGEHQAHAQGRDSLLNGAVIGAAVGAGVGVALRTPCTIRILCSANTLVAR